MALDAKQIVNAYKSLGSESIFSLNIRNFIGNTVTNKRIMLTAQKNPLSFFLFNNGISCLCTSLIDHRDRVEVTGLQVINGAQTVKALVNVARASKSTPPEWNETPPIVLVRITEIPGGYGQAGQMRESITQFNNTQNVIKVSDFRSNDSVQMGLKEQFSKIRYRGKQVDYQPKRTDKSVRNAEVVRLEEFAKTVYAFLEDPVDFSGATAFLFDEQAGGYSKIFGDGSSVWEQMPEDEFRLRAAVYWLSKEFGQRLKEERKLETDPDTRSALERKWILMNAARTVIQHYYGSHWKSQLSKTYKGDWAMGEGARGKIFLQVFRDAKAGVVMAYKNAKAHDPGFVHRNWMRSKSTPTKVAEVLNTIILVVRDPLPEMPDSTQAT